MKNVVILNGSPRKSGYTAKMIDVFVETLDKSEYNIEIFDCNKLNVNFCLDCRYCEKEFECVVKDDMQNVYSKLEEADIIVFGTPVYFYTVSAQIKRVIDRLQVYYFKNIKGQLDIKPKIGVLFSVGGAKEYKEQFKSVEVVTKGTMKNLNCSLVYKVFCSSTDNLENTKLMEVEESITNIAKGIKNSSI